MSVSSIVFERHGGFTGIPLKVVANNSNVKQQILDSMAETIIEISSQPKQTKSCVDRFSYKATIVYNGAPPRTISINDGSAQVIADYMDSLCAT